MIQENLKRLEPSISQEYRLLKESRQKNNDSSGNTNSNNNSNNIHHYPSSSSQVLSPIDMIQGSSFYETIKQVVFENYLEKQLKSNKSEPLEVTTMMKLFDELGISEVVRGSIHRMMDMGFLHSLHNSSINSKSNGNQSISRTSNEESITYIKEARKFWEDGINSELEAISTEGKRKFVVTRLLNIKNPFLTSSKVMMKESDILSGLANQTDEKNEVIVNGIITPSSHTNPIPNLSPTLTDENTVKFLYDDEDLYDTLTSIRNMNLRSSVSDRMVGMIKATLKVPTMKELREKFFELSFRHFQVGMDENYNEGSKVHLSLLHEETEEIIDKGTLVDARRLLRQGVVTSLRPKIWQIAFGWNIDDSSHIESRTYDDLEEKCHQYDVITDELYMFDVQTVIDDPKYFVFEDELKDVALRFSRDDWILHHSCYSIHKEMRVPVSMDDNHIDTSNYYLFSGVHPFAGLSLYNAPLCYIYQYRPSLYNMCRIIYSKLWCRLNVISGDDGTLLSLCKTFETILFESNPTLFLHLTRIGLNPLYVAFPWMHSAFASILEMDQILLLWDRLFGFMDIHILAILAAGIFIYRSEPLLQCTSPLDATIILQETSRIRVIPIIQMCLRFDSSNL